MNIVFQALEFRKLWTERCELRRYPDGSILESVVWNVDCARDKRLVWMDATRYLLEMYSFRILFCLYLHSEFIF